MNGANEKAVELFLSGKIDYNGIYQSIHGALNAYKGASVNSLEDLIVADAFGRDFVKNKFGE